MLYKATHFCLIRQYKTPGPKLDKITHFLFIPAPPKINTSRIRRNDLQFSG